MEDIYIYRKPLSTITPSLAYRRINGMEKGFNLNIYLYFWLMILKGLFESPS